MMWYRRKFTRIRLRHDEKMGTSYLLPIQDSLKSQMRKRGPPRPEVVRRSRLVRAVRPRQAWRLRIPSDQRLESLRDARAGSALHIVEPARPKTLAFSRNCSSLTEVHE